MSSKIKDCQLNTTSRCQEETLAVDQRLKGNYLVKHGFDEGMARKEANRCLVNNQCDSCDLCRIFCPDLCITRNEKIEIDYDFCKGCGICAFICPKGAIEMVLEES
ncbi:hypothetical protein ES708_15560 [subsurface metagenome]|jgi:2-oxoacid:acceptor oxidoreductase delta subunit (pyruvate/2-ketoisovalerate family)